MSKRTLAKLDHQYDFDAKTDETMARQHVLISAKGNPAFDICIQTDNTMLAIEIRWSDEESSDISLADIASKRDLLPGSLSFSLFFHFLQLIESAILVVLAYRELGVEASLPPNTMVLGWRN